MGGGGGGMSMGSGSRGAWFPAPVAAQQAYQRLGDDAHLSLGRQVEVKLRHRHDHGGAAALQQRLGVAQQQPVIRIHNIWLASRQRGRGCLLRTRTFGLVLLGAIEGLLGVLL